MDNFRRILLKIIVLTAIIAVLSTLVVDAKKSKKHPTLTSREDKKSYENLEKHYKKTKRSAHGRNWQRANYGNYGLPPYLVYNGKVGAYYPYFKYPENAVRRNMKNSYNRQ